MRIDSVVVKSLAQIVTAISVVALLAGGWIALGDENSDKRASDSVSVKRDEPSAVEDALFKQTVRPFLTKHCVRCHNADDMQSGIRVDQLASVIEDRHIPLWKGIQKQVAAGAMPPEEEPQPTVDERKLLDDWASKAIAAALSRDTQRNGAVRRLTVAQYRNTLRDLLGLREDLTDALPPDAVSKDGFTNNAQTLELSPLQVETYFDIAEKALDLCIVDESTKPTIQNFRMEFGTAINKEPCPDKLILGANSALLGNADFVVTEQQPQRSFDYTPFAMQRKFEFIEGYVGNDTIRAWKKFDSIYHAVFACVRGTPGYPKGLATEVIPAGLLLRPAIPSPEIFGQSNTYGPMANFKISLRELPDRGDFRVTVKAAKYDEGETSQPGKALSQRSPSLGVHLGLRRDCGSTLTRVGEPQSVSNNELQDFVFEGAINDFPTPDVEQNNVNYLAGVREIGIRSEYTDGRDMPRLLIKSIEFEGPLYDAWPPATHRNIFIDSPNKKVGWALLPVTPAKDRTNEENEKQTGKSAHPTAYAEDILRSFATRAFRRPVTPAELQSFVNVWQASFDSNAKQADAFQKSIKDALLVVLTSPQFLFLIETSNGPQAEDLDGYELASKLSYFLWNGPPDARLLELAATNKLRDSLDAETDRMVRDLRFGQFISEFGSQWLSLDKFDVVAVDAKRYPKLTRDTKTQLRQEPIHFVRHLFENNLPLRNLIDSDFVVANEVTASYYGLGSRAESGFRFVPIPHDNANLGGVLTQASILSGLSDGRESNPVKRGAWFARRIIAEPPDDPPPNVPKLPEDDASKLTLREKLERHRNQKGCVKCHSGIDPWGLPFESFDASGLPKKEPNSDTHSKLPDGAEVADLNGLKKHLTQDCLDQVAFSMVKHLATYAIGRSLTYREQMEFREQVVQLRETEYRMRDLLRFTISSDAFLKK